MIEIQTSKMDSSSISVTVQEIMKIHRSLPARPKTEEVEAAMTVVENAEREEASRLEALSSSARKNKGSSSMAEEDIFAILQEMKKSIICFQCKEKKREAIKLLELENVHVLFDELILRASNCVSGPNFVTGPSKAHTASVSVSSSGLLNKETVNIKKPLELKLLSRDDSYLNTNKVKSRFYNDAYGIGHNIESSMKHASTSGNLIMTSRDIAHKYCS